MKRLYLLRHAKSSWSEPNLADFDRPLNDRGIRAAPFMGRLAAGEKFVPQIVYSSPARRAADTARMFVENAAPGTKIEFIDRIYEASPRTLLSVAAGCPDTIDSLLIVGHNPGMEGFLSMLTGRSEPMATATLAVIDLGIMSWNEAEPGCGTLVEVIRPRDRMQD